MQLEVKSNRNNASIFDFEEFDKHFRNLTSLFSDKPPLIQKNKSTIQELAKSFPSFALKLSNHHEKFRNKILHKS
jgi:hypothetical protein